MELRELRYFLAVAQEQSITKAANYLYISQPSLSKQMQNLEKEVGRPLFVRGSRKIALTETGVLLKKRAEEMIALYEKTEAEISAPPEDVAGEVLIGGGESCAVRTVAQATGAQLTWDAQRGTAVLNTEGAVPARANYDEEELDWLARIISAESRGEPLLGQIAVGNVVLNRVADSRYPDTIQGVILDDNYGIQFEPVANGTVYQEPTQSAVLAAKLCLEGASVVEDCLYFFAPALSPGTWIVNNCTYVTTIGCHQFYR